MRAPCYEQAAECIAKGQEKYNAGDRMGALKFFEESLQKVLLPDPASLHMLPMLRLPCNVSIQAATVLSACGSTCSAQRYQVAMQSPTQEERQAALFNSTAVHASFGDVELAQITLRG